jgi:ABC-type uncharacterized transport system involved in gliding motility auxiliary subunit
VCNPKPLKAYFLTGHGGKTTEDSEDAEAYFRFAEVLRQNFVTNAPLSLAGGTNGVPEDCSLLIIAGPRKALLESEQQKLEQYLDRGGRLLVLVNAFSAETDLGLEAILAKWGVELSHDTVRDTANSPGGLDMIVYALTVHPVTRPFLGSALHVIRPRRISRIEPSARASDVPQVTELAYSSSQSDLLNRPGPPRAFPLMVAVEKSPIKGVATERGTTRIIVSGDSFLIGNQLIDDHASANLDFAHSAINWLLERTVLLENLGPKRVQEYNLLMNPGQMKAVKWILRGAMPGGILLLGGLVWFRRRK